MTSPKASNSFIFVGPLIHSIELKKLEFIPEGVIVVSKGRIVLVKTNYNDLATIKEQYNIADDDVRIMKNGQFLIPGFIDTHIHGPQYPNIGLGYDLPLLQWLEKYTFPLEKKFSSDDYAEKIYNAVVKKTLANGTTTACYFATIHKSSSVIFAKCVKELGQRAFIGKVNMNMNTVDGYGETFESSLADTRTFIQNVLALNSELVKPIITPRFALSCDMNLMKALGELASQFKLSIQTHISENRDEVALVKQQFPDCKNYLDVYDKAGLVGDKTILAHGIYLVEDELKVIKNKMATISHCPSSNTLLESGICPVRRYLDKGLKISLGTDCSGGNSASMLDSLRQTLFVSIDASFNNLGKKLSIEEAFFMATLGGAEVTVRLSTAEKMSNKISALLLEHVTGNFTVGKDFDAILVDLTNAGVVDLLEDYTLEQLFQKFIYLGDDRTMRNVFVAGNLVKCI